MSTTGNETKTNAITPEPVNFTLGKSALTINTNCGMCSHFARMAHPVYKEVCKAKGLIETNKPCVRFNPDPRQVRFNDDDQLENFTEFLATLPTSKIPLIAAILSQEHRTRKNKFHFGEVVYILAFGTEYVSNYRRCRVLSADREYVTVEGSSLFIATVMATSVFNMKRWKKKKIELLESKRLRDPNYKKYFKQPSQSERDIAKIVATQAPLQLDSTIKDVKSRPAILAYNTEGAFRKGKLKKTKKVAVVYNARIINKDITPIDELMRVRGSSRKILPTP